MKKSQRSYRYVGHLAIDSNGDIVQDKGVRSSRPHISSMDWCAYPKKCEPTARHLVAVTGPSGTYAYYRALHEEKRLVLEKNWKQLFAYPELNGELCVWNPINKIYGKGASFVGNLVVVTPPTATHGGLVHMIEYDKSRNIQKKYIIFEADLYYKDLRRPVADLHFGSDGQFLIIFVGESDKIYTMKWRKDASSGTWIIHRDDYGHLNPFGCTPSKNSLLFAACSTGSDIKVYHNYEGGSGKHWNHVATGPPDLNTVKMIFNQFGNELAVLSAEGCVRILSVNAPANGRGSLQVLYQLQTAVPEAAVPQQACLIWTSRSLVFCGKNMGSACSISKKADGTWGELTEDIMKKNTGIPPFDTIRLLTGHPSKSTFASSVGYNGFIHMWETETYDCQPTTRDLVYEKFAEGFPTQESAAELQGPGRSLVDSIAQSLKNLEDLRIRVKQAFHILKPCLQNVYQGTPQSNEVWSKVAEDLCPLLQIGENF